MNLNMDFNVDLPVFQDKYFNIKDFGAVPGGIVSNTTAVNAAISHAHSAGGGHVVIPAGLWLTGPIKLLSNIDLHIESGGVLLFDKNPEEYPVIVTNYEGVKRLRAVSPITATNCSNIAISGEGTVDGNGHLWRVVKHFKLTERQWNELLKINSYIVTHGDEMWFPTKSAYEGCLRGELDANEPGALEEAQQYYDFYRPVMVDLISCDRVLIEGVTLQNSPNWNVHPIFCTNLTVRHANIRNPYYAQNGDGIDIESCRYVELDRVCFDVGDDAICIKSGKNREARAIAVPSEDIYIHDCTVYHGHGGFVVGSEMSRGVRNVKVHNCTFFGTDTGIRFKSQLGRGGVVENIEISDISMTDIPGAAITLSLNYSLFTLPNDTEDAAKMTDTEDIPIFKDILMKNISCLHAGVGINIAGLDVSPIKDITFENVDITCDIDKQISNADNIIYNNVQLRSPSGNRK